MKRLLPALIVLFLLLTGSAFADSAGYTITAFHTSVVLNEDNTADIVETVTCDFYESRHGIVRDIPLNFTVGKRVMGTDESGYNRYATKIGNIWVGGAEGTYTEDDGVCSIRIGSADRYVQGEVTYEIGYTQSFPWDRMDTTDFFFFSVLGTGWDAPVSNFSFDVTFPKAIDPAALKLFSGPGGEENLLNVQYEVTDTTVSGYVASAGTGNAVTVFTPLPEGYFTQKKPSVIIPWLCTGLAAAAALLTLILSLTARRRRPSAEDTYYPPAELSPAEVGLFIDEIADDSDLLSLLPYWANLGFISMSEKNGQLKLIKLRELPSKAPDYQQELFKALFQSSEVWVSTLGSRFFKGYDRAKAKLRTTFTGERALYRGAGASLKLPLLCSVLVMLAMGTCAMNDILGDTFVAVAVLIPTMINAFFGRCFNRGFFDKTKKAGAFRMFLRFGLAAFNVLLAASIADIFTSESLIPTKPLVCTAALCAAACFFAYRLKVPTDYNIDTASQLLGLRETIISLKDGEMTNIPGDPTEYFYLLLPYAMVFGLTKEWAEWMQAQMLPPPVWYAASDAFDLMIMDHMIDEQLRQPIVSYHSSSSDSGSSSSSSSSGGYSGGGGGGGGGHSW